MYRRVIRAVHPTRAQPGRAARPRRAPNRCERATSAGDDHSPPPRAPRPV